MSVKKKIIASNQKKRKKSINVPRWIFIGLSVVAASVAQQYLFLRDNYSGEVPCGFVMAESSIPDAGWGIFALKDVPEGEPLPFSSHYYLFTNLQRDNLQYPGLDHILESYMWDASSIVGQFEAQTAYAFGPGLGVLANSHPQPSYINIQSQASSNRQALGGNNGTPRNTSPVAGSSTTYQNIRHQASRDVTAGNELIISYGPGWKEKIKAHSQRTKQPHYLGRPMKWLVENGRCLDLIEPIKVGERGYGISATRSMKKGERLTSIPLLPLHRSSVSLDQAPFQQLAVNYMFGNPQSSLLLLPYGPLFSLINHSNNQSNARVEWDELSDTWTKASIEDVLSRRPVSGSLLANLVATRELSKGEEILIDYGPSWQRAWNEHVAKFTPSNEKHIYASDFNNDPRNNVLKDHAEQQESPYPAHLMSICVFDPNWPLLSSERRGDYLITQVNFGHVAKSVLLPCVISQKISVGDEIHYVIQLSEFDRGPGGNAMHGNYLGLDEYRIVTNTPRSAIFFVDRPYQSDQHLPHGFRHEMQSLPYPDQWIDNMYS